MRSIRSILPLALLCTLAATPAIAQVPRQISFQGVLTDPAGTLVPDGNHSLTLKIYDASAGGNLLFTESQNVGVVRGVFNAIIGSNTPIPTSMAFDRAYFLGVTVDGGTELAPRTPMTAVPYALRATTADQALTLAAGASGVVTNVNGGDGAITLQGGGGTTINRTGNTITISSVGGSGGSGIQGVQSSDGTITITNPNGPVATLGVADNAITSAKIADGTITSVDLAAGIIPTSLPPSGSAGGDLVGTYPSPSLAIGSVNSAKIADGTITAADIAAGVIPTALPPNGAAAGDLSGTYPAPTVARIQGRGVSATAPNNGQILKWNGTAWTPAPDDQLVLPYTGIHAGGGSASFTLTNSGTIDNSRGIVSVLGAVGVAGVTTPMAIAGFAQTGHGIYGQSNGGGAGVYGSSSGASNGVSAVTFGSGNAIEAVTPTTAADVIYAHTGGTGRAGYFQIQNAANSSNAIFATTPGAGNGIMGQITLTTSGAAGVYGETNSTAGGAVTAGSSGVLGTVTSSSNGAWSAGVRGINNSTNGSGVGVIGYQAGSGFGVYGEAPLGYGTVGRSSGGTGVLADGTGAGSNALIASYSGGTASTVAANNCAIFRNSGLNVARIDNTGKGYFNGGTQNNGADVAEAFAVEGERSTYEPGDVLVISTRSDRTVEKSSTPYSTAAVGVYATKPGVLLTDRSFDTSIDDLVPMGVVGVIPTKVSSENGEIHRGDLLVTSATPGHAMKAGANPAVGTVIGKALENFEKDGTGIIKVLVNVK